MGYGDKEQLKDYRDVVISGQKFNPVTGEYEVPQPSGITAAGSQAKLTVGLTAVEAKAGDSALEGRKGMTVFNDSANIIYWGYADTVNSDCMAILPGCHKDFSFDPNVATAIYIVASAADSTVKVNEWK